MFPWAHLHSNARRARPLGKKAHIPAKSVKGQSWTKHHASPPPSMVPGWGSAYGYIQGVPRLVSQVTPPFSRTYVDVAGCPFTCWTSNGLGLIVWKKILTFFILAGSGPRTSSAWFSGSSRFAASSSSCYPLVFNFLAWKRLHMVNMTSKYEFLRSDLPCEVVFRSKSWIPRRIWN